MWPLIIDDGINHEFVRCNGLKKTYECEVNRADSRIFKTPKFQEANIYPNHKYKNYGIVNVLWPNPTWALLNAQEKIIQIYSCTHSLLLLVKCYISLTIGSIT